MRIRFSPETELFARACHTAQPGAHIHTDPLARRLLGEEACGALAAQWSPLLKKTQVRQCLGWFPARAAWLEAALKTAAATGARQCLLLGAGYETLPWRQPEWAGRLTFYELDAPGIQEEKTRRLQAAGLKDPANLHRGHGDLSQGVGRALQALPGFSPGRITFCWLPDAALWLSPLHFDRLLGEFSLWLPLGSTLAFDLPQGAGYSPKTLERLLSRHGDLLYEYADAAGLTGRFYTACGSDTQGLSAPPGMAACLAVRHRPVQRKAP